MSSKGLRWTIHDLEAFPDNDGKRYEIIDGELYISKQWHWLHQRACGHIYALLTLWSKQTGLGEANLAPTLCFADDFEVIPDVVWLSRELLKAILKEDGKLHGAPELVIEVVSPGEQNERRDREVKRKLYSRYGISEYWVIDCRKQMIEVHRLERASSILEVVQTLFEKDILRSPLLPGFSCKVGELFEDIV
jgi:Uma2 family endonuclease